ncbi:MAG: SIMPL domain-containing protein [Pseudomonadaceae bacterium]|nr:SIMPL domain-containing protein [Pseudomonadaceae bacterium]
MSGISSPTIVVASALLAAGIATAGYFASETLSKSHTAINTAEAKGLAERRVRSDLANWTVSYRVAGASRAEVPALYALSESHRDQIIALLMEAGLTDDEITEGVVDYRYQEYRDDDQNLVDERHILAGSISVETSNVGLIPEVRGKVNRLIADGIDISNNSPAYRFTGLNDIKPDMLKEATTNARIAANEFASNAGIEVGGIRSARQGSFFVRDAGEEYSDTQKIEKDVRVVTTITFYLTE